MRSHSSPGKTVADRPGVDWRGLAGGLVAHASASPSARKRAIARRFMAPILPAAGRMGASPEVLMIRAFHFALVASLAVFLLTVDTAGQRAQSFPQPLPSFAEPAISPDGREL